MLVLPLSGLCAKAGLMLWARLRPYLPEYDSLLIPKAFCCGITKHYWIIQMANPYMGMTINTAHLLV